MNPSGEFDVREVKPGEIDEMLALRNSIFGRITREHWDAMDCTAAVAKRDGEFFGAIPLQYRNQLIRPGLSIPVVYENAVGVSEKARGTGVGTAMLEAAASFMADRVDALFVYRGGERTDGYRFYRKTGHGDISNEVNLTLDNPVGVDNDVAVLDIKESVALEHELLAVFRKVFARFAGYQKREAGYFGKVLGAHVFKNDAWRLFIKRTRGKIVGYAIVNPVDRLKKGFCLYDYAAAGHAVFEKLMAKIEFCARKAGQPVFAAALGRENPFLAYFVKTGYAIVDDTPYVMARIIRGGRLFRRLAEKSPDVLDQLKLTAVTPHRDVVLNDPKNPAAAASLYLKEGQLSRLLTCRLNFTSALRMDLVRLSPLPGVFEKALSKVFRFAPWVNFRIDYV